MLARTNGTATSCHDAATGELEHTLAHILRPTATRILPARLTVRCVVAAPIIHTATGTDAEATRVVARAVLNIRERQRPGRQLILVRRRRARDIRPLQVHIALHGDVESTVSGLNTRRLVHASIIAARISMLRTGATEKYVLDLRELVRKSSAGHLAKMIIF